MSILSDIEIRELCVLPDEIVDEREYLKLVESTPMPSVYYPDPLYRAEVMAKRNEEFRRRAMRPPTQEERDAFVPMIEPYLDGQCRRVNDRRVISYGTSSYGYDCRLAEEFKIFSNVNSAIIDPKRLDEACLIDARVQTDTDGSRFVILPPNSYLLGHTVEYFRMPRDVLLICVGKSTMARAGIAVNVTPIEPGFHGHVVIEVANLTSLPAKIYAGEGIAQMIAFRGSPCETSYADRGGKYMHQTGIALPRM